MSESSSNPTQVAPSQINTILGDRPIGITDQGGQVRPTMYFAQMLQRLVSYIGQPVGSDGLGGRPGETLSEQTAGLNALSDDLLVRSGTDPTLLDRLFRIERMLLRLSMMPSGGGGGGGPSPPGPPKPILPAQVTFPITGVVYLLNGARVLDGYGTPESAVYGRPGDLFLRRDGATGEGAYVKDTGDNTDTGWIAVGSGGDIWAPLVNGDLPGPTIISDPDGQVVMVQIA